MTLLEKAWRRYRRDGLGSVVRTAWRRTSRVEPQPARVSSERTQRFERDGYLIVQGLLPSEEAATLRDYYMDIHARRAIPGYDDGLPESDILHEYPRLVHPHRTDERARRYVLDPRIEAVLRALFGEAPLAAQSMVYYKPPGARGQGLHQEQMAFHVSPGTCIGCWLALDPADGDNGGVLVVPGSQRLGLVRQDREADDTEFYDGSSLPVPEGHRVVQMQMNAGDALFFSGLVIHGSYANRSQNRFRRCFVGHYVARSTQALAEFYHPLLAFSGEEVRCGVARGGVSPRNRRFCGPSAS